LSATDGIKYGSADIVKDGVTAYHAKYYAHDLTRRASGGLDRISMSLFDATVEWFRLFAF
jgi:hypothetical protein